MIEMAMSNETSKDDELNQELKQIGAPKEDEMNDVFKHTFVDVADNEKSKPEEVDE